MQRQRALGLQRSLHKPEECPVQETEGYPGSVQEVMWARWAQDSSEATRRGEGPLNWVPEHSVVPRPQSPGGFTPTHSDLLQQGFHTEGVSVLM